MTSHYKPDINPTCRNLVAHYDVAVPSARARRLTGKAKMKNGMSEVRHWVLAWLSHQRLASMGSTC